MATFTGGTKKRPLESAGTSGAKKVSKRVDSIDSYIPIEKGTSKNSAKEYSKRIDSIDSYIPIEKGTSKQVHLQILQGDILTENTEAVVVFRSQDGTAEGDSKRLLQKAGDRVEAEYQAARAKGGRNVAKGVVLTGAGDLALQQDAGDQQESGDVTHRKHILHIHVSHHNPVSHDDVSHHHKQISKFRDTIYTALRLAEKKEIKSISFPPLPHTDNSAEQNTILLEICTEFTEVNRPIRLHFIQLVTPQGIDVLKQLLHDNPFLDEVCDWELPVASEKGVLGTE